MGRTFVEDVAHDGYIAQVLDALTSNPEVWSKTAFFLNYDENGGLFDHMVPPTPPESRSQGLSSVTTENKIYPGNPNYKPGPYGLGVRVPMIVISPWSKGGWVNSEVFDHTSLIQFIETRFGAQVRSPNITPWHRAVTGQADVCVRLRRAQLQIRVSSRHGFLSAAGLRTSHLGKTIRITTRSRLLINLCLPRSKGCAGLGRFVRIARSQ